VVGALRAPSPLPFRLFGAASGQTGCDPWKVPRSSGHRYGTTIETVRHLSYVAVLVVCLAAVLPLQRRPGVRVLRRPARLIATLVLVAVPFGVWDALATAHGQWRFDPAQTLSPRLFGLPLEEIAFFVVIPTAIVSTMEAVRALRADRAQVTGRQNASGGRR
jgi:lycopene cyclase domain-containing protein